MPIFTRILVGLLIAALGVFMVYKTDIILSMMGRTDFAERLFGGGGSRFFYKLCGIFVAILGIIIMTNLFEVLFGGFILSIFRIS